MARDSGALAATALHSTHIACLTPLHCAVAEDKPDVSDVIQGAERQRLCGTGQTVCTSGHSMWRDCTMTYFTMVPLGAPYQISGDWLGWKEKVPDAHRRAEISGNWMYGRGPLNPDEMPSALRLKREPKTMPDVFFSNGGITVCSERMRRVIESLDSGIHQFIPIAIILPNGHPLATPYSILQVYRTYDTICDDQTKSKKTAGTVPGQPRRNMRSLNYGLVKKHDVAVFKASLPSANLWREKAYYQIYMMSDVLFNTFKEHGMKFFKTQQAIEV